MIIAPSLIADVASVGRAALLPLVSRDWTITARDLDWSCAQTATHIADSYFAHAARIVAQPSDWFVPASITPDETAGPVQLLQIIGACAELLRCAAIDADPTTRAFHPWGRSDPAGSLAMGAAEGLVHTWDICSALGSDWLPPDELCIPVLTRLFPDAPDAEPAAALLWCTGRSALPSLARRLTWRWDSSVRG